MRDAPASSEVVHPDDLALAQAAARGDRRAQQALAARLLDHVRATVRYLVAEDRDADDLCQAAMVRVLLNVGSFGGHSSLERWADRVAVRLALRQLSQRRRREAVVAFDVEAYERASGDQGEDLGRRELRRHLAALLQKIAPERRTALLLKVVHQYSVEEIAEITEAPINTVRDRLAKAKLQLRKKIVQDRSLRELMGSDER